MADLGDVALPAVATLGLGLAIPLVTYAVLSGLGRMKAREAAAFAAFYGSVSAVTFTAATTFLDKEGIAFEGFMPSLLALLEVPGIVVALVLAARFGGNMALRPALHEVLTGRSVVLLVGGLAIGWASGADAPHASRRSSSIRSRGSWSCSCSTSVSWPARSSVSCAAAGRSSSGSRWGHRSCSAPSGCCSAVWRG